MTPEKQLRIIAHHEAGHCVADYRFGLPIEFVTVVPDDADGSLGKVRSAAANEQTARGPQLMAQMMISTLAGPAAQRRYAPRSPVRWNGRSDFAMAAFDSRHLSSTPESERSVRHWAKIEAKHLVAKNWHLICPLAAELVERGTLTAADVSAVLDPIVERDKALAAEVRRELMNADASTRREMLDRWESDAEAAWRLQRRVTRADVASSMLRVMGDLMALGGGVDLHKVRSAVVGDLQSRGFAWEIAEAKVNQIIEARRPFVGWRQFKPHTERQ